MKKRKQNNNKIRNPTGQRLVDIFNYQLANGMMYLLNSQLGDGSVALLRTKGWYWLKNYEKT